MADNIWAEGSDLAGMSRSGNVLQQLGYDPDEVRMNPGLRGELMAKLAGPYAAPRQAPPVQMAQNNMPPAPPQSANPRSQNGNDISAPAGQPRLFNRVQPTVPQQPVPSTLGSATVDASTPPATSASVSPTGTTTAAPGNTVDIANARTAAGNLLAPEPDIPDTSAQDSMIAAKSVPLNQRDPMYREGTPGKIGRGFKAAAVGFMRGGVPASIGGAADPALVGEKPYNAPNSDYDIDDQTRQAQLALAQKQKLDAMAKFKVQADLRKQQDAASKDAGEISNTTAKLPNETATAAADTARAYNDSPTGKAEAAKQLNTVTMADRNAQLSDPKSPLSKMSPSNKMLYLANGKVPDPRQATAEEIARAQATAAWQRDNPGKKPGLDDIRSINAAVSGSEIKGGAKNGKISPALQNKILDEKKAAMDLATAQYRDGMDKSGQPFKQTDYVAAMQAAQDKFESAIEAEGGTTDHMTINQDGSWTAEKPEVSPQSPSVPLPPVGPENQIIKGQNGERYRSDGKTWQPLPKKK